MDILKVPQIGSGHYQEFNVLHLTNSSRQASPARGNRTEAQMHKLAQRWLFCAFDEKNDLIVKSAASTIA